MRSPYYILLFVALLVGCASARAQESVTGAVAPPETSTSAVALQTAQAPPALADGLTAAVPATRVSLPPTTPPDPLEGLYGRYSCRFATAGRVTPCCPDAISTLAQFWSGSDLAIADYIAGREGGCQEAIINSSGCIGWFQLCGWKCNGPCTVGYNNAAKALELQQQYGWCSTASWYLRGDPVTGHC